MKLLKNLLYVQTQGAWLQKDGENLVMRVEQQEKARLPMHKLQGIITFGQISISPYLMAHAMENGISITYLNEFGRFLARVEGPLSGNILLRQTQYRLADDSVRSQAIARNMITGKLYNQRAVIRRYLRDYKDETPTETTDKLNYADKRLSVLVQKIQLIADPLELLGREGEAAAVYFGVFGHFIRQTGIVFDGRERRPPRDAMNALLSFGYTLMTHECRSALESCGLDAQNGFFHRPRPGRPSLALDLLEEFRPIMDRFMLSLINRGQLNLNDFRTEPNGAVTLEEKGRRTLLRLWHERKQDELLHPWFEEKVPLGLLPWLQAQILMRHLRGDTDAYVPFLWK